jgi:hypothetical protein
MKPGFVAPRRNPVSSFVATAVLIVATFSADAQSLKLSDVVARLDRYLESYETTLAAVVAEERYWQALEFAATPARGRQSRTLISDYALARSPGGHAWTGFRDTYEVDGVQVRDRQDRLVALMAEGSVSSARQALQISRANARHNLGEEVVARTINVPTVALDFIHPRNRSRLAIEKRGEETLNGVRVWTLAFREQERPTLLRTPDGRDRRARGELRVDPDTGEVLRTDLTWDGSPGGFIVVHYRRDDRIGALVPDTMLEEYRGARGLVTGKATYTNYRRFETAARVVTPAER